MYPLDDHDLADLWRFDVTTKQWAYLAGSTLSVSSIIYGSYPSTVGAGGPRFYPGGRTQCSLSLDADRKKLYLFGGKGRGDKVAVTYFNEIWEFDIPSLTWYWLGGSKTSSLAGTYSGATTLAPGGRQGHISFFDPASKSMFVFGGYGYGDSTTGMLCVCVCVCSLIVQAFYLNDVWSFTMKDSTPKWTWFAGPSTEAEFKYKVTYGSQGVESTGSTPSGRFNSAFHFNQTTRMLHVFGGYGYQLNSYAYRYTLGDVWRFSVTTRRWTFIGNFKTTNTIGTIGALGVESAGNRLGSFKGASMVELGGRLYTFGGDGYGSSSGSM